jgi:hypothetical protein
MEKELIEERQEPHWHESAGWESIGEGVRWVLIAVGIALMFNIGGVTSAIAAVIRHLGGR